MKFLNGSLRLSPTDLANSAACPHLTSLDIAAARGQLTAPHPFSHVTDTLRKRGEAHEAAYVASLVSRGLTVTTLRQCRLDDNGAAATLAAMHSGVSIIVQAPLVQDGWAGFADILRRVETPSVLGAWSYEPLDTKLARETRGSAILQLCAYAAILEDLQQRAPAYLHVVSPGAPFTPHTFRRADYDAYYRLVRRRLQARAGSGPAVVTYPDPVAHCEVCRWRLECDARRRRDDHLYLVANIRSLQIAQLQAWGIRTLEALGTATVPFAQKPDRGTLDALYRAREQARVQLAGRQSGVPVHELLPLEPGKGLHRLPEPSAGDIFFDLEGDPFVPDDGREYLFGYACADADGLQADRRVLAYHAHWALTPAEEKTAFEAFVDFVVERRRRHPGLHIYHYAPYEPAAMKRLMGRYASREDEIDGMLRAELFVDLYGVVRQSVRASVERYSIKTMEPFYGYTRQIALPLAGGHLRHVEMLLEFGAGAIPADSMRAVELYNEDDCLSARELRDWLESLRSQVIAGGHDMPRPSQPDGDASEALTARQRDVRALMDRLLIGVPIAIDERSVEQQARWLLAQVLEFHRREDKAVWWEFFRLADLPIEDYADEPSAVAGLQLLATFGGTEKAPVHRYTFPPQEFKKPDQEVYFGKDDKLGTVEDCNIERRTIDIKKLSRVADLHPENVFFFCRVRTEGLQQALFDMAAWVADHHLDAPGPYRAARDLLLRRTPRLTPGCAWSVDGELPAARARRLVVALEDSVLPVQGPPGSGKTYIAAQMVCALVRLGRKVGVTATSHKVIRNLLDAVIDAATAEALAVRCIHKVNAIASTAAGPIAETTDNAVVLAALESGEADVAAGTAWLWSRPELRETVDVLIVDEAGQMALANAAAAGHAARSLVLLGDPQQLEQPLKGSHPDGTAVSALHHVLGTHQTMPEDRGIFLGETWRLSPAVCAFTSDVFYEGRLAPRSGLEVQQLHGSGVKAAPLRLPAFAVRASARSRRSSAPNERIGGGTPDTADSSASGCGCRFAGSGLWYVPVVHAGNQNQSREEADVVAALAHQLVAGYTWTNQQGVTSPIGWADVLIVAPYNSQVYAIQERLPLARAGTVDRFQGQEAAVVIYSATTSSPEDAPRGMEFLYSLNRLNVATSRARCAVFLVASPKLFEPDCQTPRQMQLANALCRYLEMAKTVDV